jgi:hypothetical protein
MKRKILMALVSGLLVMSAVGSAFAGHGPGPGGSHNGQCTGNPADRIGGCK